MELGFKSNLQFLIYINSNDSLPSAEFNLPKKANTQLHHQHQILANCLQLFIKAKRLYYHIKSTNLTPYTIALLQAIFQYALIQFSSIYHSQHFFMKKGQIFYTSQSSCSQVMKIVEDRSFYDAMLVHKQNLQQTATIILFDQQICLSFLRKAYLSVNGTDLRILPSQSRLWQIGEEYNSWRHALTIANFVCLKLCFLLKRYLIDKKKFFRKIISDKAMPKERIHELILFGIWMAKQQQAVFQKIQKNQKLINQQILKFQKLIKAICFKLPIVDSDYQQYRTLINHILKQSQLILQGYKLVRRKEQYKNQYQGVPNYSKQILDNIERAVYLKMEIYENEIITQLNDFYEMLKKEL